MVWNEKKKKKKKKKAFQKPISDFEVMYLYQTADMF